MFAALRSALCAAGFVLLWTWVALQTQRLDPLLGFEVAAWWRWPGILVGALGALLTLACVVSFVARGRGTPAPFDPPRELVAVGPYRWVRNPMYLGAAGVILGAGLIVGSPGICLLAPAFLLFFHLLVVLYEEPTLERTFGDSYRRYRRDVHRWLPSRP